MCYNAFEVINMKSTVLSVKYSDGTSHFSRHYHDCHEIFYVTGGKATVTVNSKTYPVHSGMLVIISRYEKHSVTVESHDYTRYTLRLAPDYYGENNEDYALYSLLTNRPESFVHAIDVSYCKEEFDGLFGKIKHEYDKKTDYCSQMLDMLLKEILIMLYRKEPSLFSHSDEHTVTIVGKIQRQFQQKCNEKYTLEDLSAQYNISVYYLSHLFKKVTGYSVMNYLLSCRIANAKKLLANTDMDIGEICHRCGFSDSSNFSRMFKNETGFTPTAFRKS